MRKITVVLVGVALLLIAGSANAANNGTGDPLGLISSAVIQPFYSNTIDNTLIEVASPLDDNALEVIYFNATCNQLQSFPKEVTRKGVIVFSPDVDLAPFGAPPNGLAVIARTQNNVTFIPIPDSAAIHVTAYWFNLLGDFVRRVDPTAVTSPETGVGANLQTYSALRSGVSFGAPIDIAPFFTTTIHLICPSATVYGTLPTAAGFPTSPVVATSLFGLAYDGDENFLFDFMLACSCSTMIQLTTIHPLYGALLPTLLSFTELTSYAVLDLSPTPTVTPAGVCNSPGAPVVCNPPAFMGYRALRVLTALDDFGRLHNGSAYNYLNSGDEHVGLFDSVFVPGLR